ncbi:hypothetical protein B0H13DRAFT_2053710 [Mycena leptocephala]|nr:hypothetical protein B0H13DRAFT_2053710 [Mycena leptocephala]
MPARHVRFSLANTFHSPPPQPPPLMSPASSSSASPLGPLTPPPAPYVGYAGAEPFGLRKSYNGSPAARRRAHTTAEIRSLTVSPTLSTHYVDLSSAIFLESAVYPPQPAITLTTPYLPWSIIASASNTGYVTIADVLNAIYHTLRVNVTQGEFEALRTDKLMRRVSAAYKQRCERLRGHRGYAQARAEGVKRVDFLMGYTEFQGIAPTAAPDVWQVAIS